MPALELARVLKQVAVVVIVRILLLRRRACLAAAAPFEMLVFARYASDTRPAVWARVALQAQAVAHVSRGRKTSRIRRAHPARRTPTLRFKLSSLAFDTRLSVVP